MSRDPARAATQFFGERVCLDFANTLDWRTSDAPQELIPDYGSLLSWCLRRGTLAQRSIVRLRAKSAEQESSTQAAMSAAYSLRSEIWTAADALRGGHPVGLATINAMLTKLPSQPKIVESTAGFVHDLKGADLQEPLWPVLWSLAALLTSRDATRVGCCEAQGCGWFFVDESPNHSRVWCSSEVCGNRERARRAYAKRRVKS